MWNCWIVTNKDITHFIRRSKRLEYRGYDSSGLIVLSKNNTFDRARSVGKVKNLEDNLKARDQKLMEILELLIRAGQLMVSLQLIMLILIYQ